MQSALKLSAGRNTSSSNCMKVLQLQACLMLCCCAPAGLAIVQPLNPAAPVVDHIRDRAVQRICNMTAVSTDTPLAWQTLLLMLQSCMHAVFLFTLGSPAEPQLK